MVKKKVALITGVAGFWGYRVAKKLLELDQFHIIGIDRDKPDPELQELDFIQADIRNPLMIDLLKSENIDTVCHLDFLESLKPTETAFDQNVMGVIKLFGACVEAGVRKIVMKSSTMVYGAQSTNPGFLHEDSPLQGSWSYGYIRDLVEIEAFCNGFRRQHPQILMTILRFPNILGPSVDSPLTRFLSDPLAPILLGFDPMLQIVHEKDVVRGLVHVLKNDYPGVFNVGAQGILPLLRIMSLAGKIPIPVIHLFAYWSVNVLGAKAQKHLPIDPDYLRYRWVADLTLMEEQLGFVPSYTADEALREYSGELRTRDYLPRASDLAFDEDRLRDTIERRQRERAATSRVNAPASTRGRSKKS